MAEIIWAAPRGQLRTILQEVDFEISYDIWPSVLCHHYDFAFVLPRSLWFFFRLRRPLHFGNMYVDARAC